MTNRAQRGATWRAARLKATAADLVTYTRGGETLADLSATIGTTTHDDIAANGMLTAVESNDFVITAADLILSAAVTLPVVGDVITWGGETYEVRPFGEKQRPWRYSDPHKVTLRIHTKRTG